MFRSVKQIKGIGLASILAIFMAIALEIGPYVLKGHKAFLINILVGFACSGCVVILGELIEYKRLNQKIKHEIDLRLKILVDGLEKAKNQEDLLGILKVRDEEFEEYRIPFHFAEQYRPFKNDKEQKEYSEKISVLDYEMYVLFYSTLDIYIQADNKKESEYYELIGRASTKSETTDKRHEIKQMTDAIKGQKRLHVNSMKSEIKKLEKKIKKFG